MITPGKHHVTGGLRLIVECDHTNCVQSLYLPGGTIYAAGQAMTALDWRVGDPHYGRPITALCPMHATTGEAA